MKRFSWLMLLCAAIMMFAPPTLAAGESADVFTLVSIDIKDKIKNGGKFKLSQDISLDTATLVVPSGKNVSIDLNGHCISSSSWVIQNQGILRILDTSGDGKIVSTGGCAINAILSSKDNPPKLFLGVKGNSNDFKVEAQEAAVMAFDGATVYIYGGTYIAKDNFVLGTNGSTNRGNNKFEIYGGTFSGTIQSYTKHYIACGIYAANSDDWYIEGGTFDIKRGVGILARAGIINIPENSKLKITTTKHNSWDIGCVGDSKVTVPCAAVVFDVQANYPGFKNASKDSKIIIAGGAFSSDVDTISVVPSGDNAPVNRVQVTGGVFSDANLTSLDKFVSKDKSIIVALSDTNYNYGVYKYGVFTPKLSVSSDGEILSTSSDTKTFVVSRDYVSGDTLVLAPIASPDKMSAVGNSFDLKYDYKWYKLSPDTSTSVDMTSKVTSGELTLSLDVKSSAAYVVVATTHNVSISVDVKVTINPVKLSGSVTASTSLSYTGKSQDLIASPDAIVGGYFMFASSDTSSTTSLDALAYSTAIPWAIDAGTYRVWYQIVPSNDNYQSSDVFSVDVSIQSASITNATVTISPAVVSYDGREHSNDVTVTVKSGDTVLSKDTDYTVSFSQAVKIGTVTVTVTGTGNYTGTATANYTIKTSTSYTDYSKSVTSVTSNDNTSGGSSGAPYYSESTTNLVLSRDSGTGSGDAVNLTVLSVDVKISTSSTDWHFKTGETTSHDLSVDVTLSVDKNYSFDISGLELSFDANSLTLNVSSSDNVSDTGWINNSKTYSYLFSISGNVASVDVESVDVTFTANVKLSTDIQGIDEPFASVDKTVTIYLEKEKDDTPKLLSLSVDISGGNTISTTEGTAASSDLTATVTATYSDGKSYNVTSSSDIKIMWSIASSNISGVTLTNKDRNVGILNVDGTTASGSYDVTVRVVAALDGRTVSKDYEVKVAVSASPSDEPVVIAPKFGSSTYTTNMQLNQDSSYTITLQEGTSSTWSVTKLPGGLTFTSTDKSITITGKPTKIGSKAVTIEAKNSAGSATTTLTIKIYDNIGSVSNDEGTYEGTVAGTKTATDANGNSVTTTTTVFYGADGKTLILSAEISIITASADKLTVNAGSSLNSTVSVNVKLKVLDKDYVDYVYSMNVKDLPSGMTSAGDLSNSDVIVADDEGNFEKLHVFTIYGKPLATSTANFAATVEISHWDAVYAKLLATGSKDVTITVNSEDVTPPASEDVTPPASEDVTPPASEDVTPPASEDVTPPATEEKINIDSDGNLTIENPITENLSDVLDTLTEEQKQSIKTITISETMTDLSGIDALTHLDKLDLTKAKSLTEVNLTGNTSVKEVDVRKNPSITSLNLARSFVRNVDTSGATNIEEINLENCTKLVSVDISESPATNLNLNGCVNLVTVKCDNCRLTEVKFRGCNKLETLSLPGNCLLTLDANSDILPNLKYLECGNQRRSGFRPNRLNRTGIGFTFNLFNMFRNVVDFFSSEAIGGASTSEFADKVDGLKAFDEFGRPLAVTFDKETGETTFIGTPDKFQYYYDTGFKCTKMDVKVGADYSITEETPSVGSSGGGGGCDAGLGFGALTAIFALAVALRRKH